MVEHWRDLGLIQGAPKGAKGGKVDTVDRWF